MADDKVDPGTAIVVANKAQEIVIAPNYQEMCATIAKCARVDEVQEVRIQAVALEEYARQAKNYEAEKQLSAIRLRAERRAGEILAEMKERGERANEAGSNGGVKIFDTPTLPVLGITRNESADWQQLAKMPEKEFEDALAKPEVKRTYKVLAEHKKKKAVTAVAQIIDVEPVTDRLPEPPRRKESADERHCREDCETAVRLADGKTHSVVDIAKVIDRGDRSVEVFLSRVKMLPWLTVEKVGVSSVLTSRGKNAGSYRLTVDEGLRAICDGRAPRPKVSGGIPPAKLKQIMDEFHRLRKENNEKKNNRPINLSNVLKVDMISAANWIEEALAELYKQYQPEAGAQSPDTSGNQTIH